MANLTSSITALLATQDLPIAAEELLRLLCAEETPNCNYPGDLNRVEATLRALPDVKLSRDPMTVMPAKKRSSSVAFESLDQALDVLPRRKRRLDTLIRENNFRNHFAEVCQHSTRPDCEVAEGQDYDCPFIHFQVILQAHTEPSLGDCSYLNTCHRPDTCRYIHYELEDPGPTRSILERNAKREKKKRQQGDHLPRTNGMTPSLKITEPLPPQWIECDLRSLDPTALGHFDVVMADPPWDIHQSLPYGTMSDDEMRSLPVPTLQKDGGLLFLWVTGRAMEVGRDCLAAWGYERIEEIVWIKTSQLQRLIRTGRTGHWLNHSKEHCLVAYKKPASTSLPTTASRALDGDYPALSWANRGLDTDCIVAQVRETSRKPDEIYKLIERLCPSGKRLELFGRMHNTRPGWLTLGNQLEGRSHIEDESIRERWNARHPDYPL